MIHPTAIVEDAANIGNNTKIWQWAHIRSSARIGEDCMIGAHVHIGPNVHIGNRVRIQNGAFIPDGVMIGDDVFVGPYVVFTNDKYPPSNGKGWNNTFIKDGASIGANSTIISGIVIGYNSKIGAGSVVTKSVGDNELAYGNPARVRVEDATNSKGSV